MGATDHHLDPLLRPRSIALVGASPREGSYGRRMADACLAAGFPGDVFLVNPGYDSIDGRECYPDVGALPYVPDHAALMVANERLEPLVRQVAEAGVKAATIFGTCHVEGLAPPLADRLRALADDHGLLICGGNSLGFYNRESRVRCQLGGGTREEPGTVTVISQSGSILLALGADDGRLRYNLTVSSGHEITTDASDYMDFALTLDNTRAVGLFIETVRKPDVFVAALKRAADSDVPVVVNKVARSEQGKRFAVSHSGALAGDDTVFDAVLDRFGALRVEDPDEFVATLQMLSSGRRPAGAGAAAAITDSGGERELLADVAADHGVAFAPLADETSTRIAGLLDPGMDPGNPLDAFGTGHGFEEGFEGCMSAMLADPKVAVGIWVADLFDDSPYHQGYVRAARRIAANTDKPLVFATCYSRTRSPALRAELAAAGIPVLDGVRPAMVAVRHALAFRDYRRRAPANPPAWPDAPVLERWTTRLAGGGPLDEAASLEMLGDFGIPTVAHRVVQTRDEAIEAAAALGFPVALKTAAPGVMHKSDVDGVRLDLATGDEVQDAYDDLASRFGPGVLVARMVPAGPELAFGCVVDPQFGPVAMIGAGGTLVEVFRDVRFALPPVDRAEARALIDGLAVRPLLDGHRGAPAADPDALAGAFARFTALVAAVGHLVTEIDVNPVIATADGPVAVDALVAARAAARE